MLPLLGSNTAGRYARRVASQPNGLTALSYGGHRALPGSTGGLHTDSTGSFSSCANMHGPVGSIYGVMGSGMKSPTSMASVCFALSGSGHAATRSGRPGRSKTTSEDEAPTGPAGPSTRGRR